MERMTNVDKNSSIVFTICIFSDGYAKHDLDLHWKSETNAVHGIEKIELPQFSIVEYRTIEKVESLLSGRISKTSTMVHYEITMQKSKVKALETDNLSLNT